ncbi:MULTISPECIES: hypothetical protein [Pseudomonas syringae group]|uniref:Uncharacterized protein n=3 Tax=Pseudomonas syringae group TaxID=136849 RepID=A0A0P9N2B3_PSECA|nr:MULTISPECIES: hypothetical protein [Pseudomonas syringae group]KAA8714069.1 hypothetical protein F4W70_07690 [Pseudomonas cannabina]KPB74580.1 Uncharacterized protein AC507_4591 [Pseudomonas syringae pv. maculicola]KPW24156.1 Uncharacterized protein ALO83_02927 [Pseudomonas cannabina pv. alisalensis]KPW76911.1 Uncharacterized protein ALO81_02660 [Pseudomonas cannabina]MBM0139855.1 hypothetical protein [Pseudomonas cannabina pv. alisalensis]
MSSVTRRRDLYVSLKLIVCIALGIWLGAMAVFLTGLLYYKSLPPAQTQALEQAATQLSAPPAQKAGKVAEPETEMFRKYEQSLRESEARQAREQVEEQQQRTFSRSKCDFWLQQDRTAPSEKSRASINQFCG